MQAVNFPEPIDWSPDGGLLLLERLTPDGGLWTVPVEGSAEPTPFVTPSSYWVESGRFSPDGRFVSYVSDESGRFEIYVETFPHGGGKRKVSTEGGTAPRWRSDGGELYYVDLAERRLMAVPIQGSESGSFVPDLPRPLFVMSDDGYEPAPDGERFLVLEPADPPRRPATIVLGWDARLRGDD